MSTQLPIASARARLASLLDRVEAGERVALTRRGKAVAVLVSPAELERLEGGQLQFRDAYRSFLTKHGAHREGVERGFFDDLRDRSEGRKVDL